MIYLRGHAAATQNALLGAAVAIILWAPLLALFSVLGRTKTTLILAATLWVVWIGLLLYPGLVWPGF